MAHYDDRLFKQAAKGLLTAKQVGQIVGCYGVDALTRLRTRRDVRVTVAGRLQENGQRGPAKKLYRIEKIEKLSGAYCCGFCEQQRQLNLSTDSTAAD